MAIRDFFLRKRRLKRWWERLAYERFILAEITDGHPLSVSELTTYTMEDGYQQFLAIVVERRWQIVKFEAMPNRMRVSVLVEGENKQYYERWGGIARYVLMPARELYPKANEPFVGPAFEEWPPPDREVWTDWYKHQQLSGCGYEPAPPQEPAGP